MFECGANIHTQNNDGNTPLHWAASKGYSDVVKLLIDKGADVSALNKAKERPLECALVNGHKKR